MSYYFLDELQPDEIPRKVQIRPLDAGVQVSWEPTTCYQSYGRLIYYLSVFNKTYSTNFSLQTNTSYKIGGLQPYTAYTLTIVAARNGRNIYQNKYVDTLSYNFTTSAGGLYIWISI